MEVLEVLTIMAIFFIGSGFLIFLYKFLPNLTKKTRPRQSKTATEEVVNTNIREIQEAYQTQIEVLKKDRMSLQNTINRMKRKFSEIDNDEEEELDPTQYYIDKKAVEPFMNNLGMNPEGLDSPIVQQMVFDKLKGNEELALMLGIIKPKQQLGQESQTSGNKSDLTDTIQELISKGQVA